MPPKVQALAVVASLGLLSFILYLIRKGRLREEYAILWLMAGFSILVLSAWRGSLTTLARTLDIGYAPSLLFAVGLVFTLLILLAQTAVLSRLASHTRDLAQELSILQWQVDQLQGESEHHAQVSRASTADDTHSPANEPTNRQSNQPANHVSSQSSSSPARPRAAHDPIRSGPAQSSHAIVGKDGAT